jgi:sporulation protein YlmC with PRC-barrel domain
MAHYGTLRDFKFKNDEEDIRGAVVYGADNEKLGKIEDVVFDHDSGNIKYVVIDSGGWFRHKLFLVPANRIHGYDKDKDAFQVDLVKDQIQEDFPAYDRDKMQTEQDFADYEKAILGVWADDVVMHRQDRLDLNITPERIETDTGADIPRRDVASVPLGSMGEEVTPEVAQSAREDVEREVEEDLANRDLSPHWHPRMKRFEDVLRENRVDVTASCGSCARAKDKAA